MELFLGSRRLQVFLCLLGDDVEAYCTSQHDATMEAKKRSRSRCKNEPMSNGDVD